MGIKYEGAFLYSLVAICKTCQRRVLDEQVSMTLCSHKDKCIYCLIKHLNTEIVDLTRKRDDLFFSFQILEFSYSEVHAAYEAAIQDNKAKQEEIADTRKELLDYLNLFEMKESEENTAPYVDPKDPMRLKKPNGF